MSLALAQRPSAPDLQAVALKAVSRIADQWGLTLAEAAALADMSPSTWKRARKPGFAGELRQDQMLRFSALTGIYKGLALFFDAPLSQTWMTRANTGPLYDGARPVDALIAGGLPAFLATRTYVDALRGGA